MLKNMMWMMGGAAAGFLASRYSKDIKRLAKKGKRELSKTASSN